MYVSLAVKAAIAEMMVNPKVIPGRRGGGPAGLNQHAGTISPQVVP